MHYERCNVNQNLFYALQELHYVNKSKVTGSFRGNWYGLYFLALFYFSLLLSIGKRSTLAKICGGCSPPHPALPPPQFLLAWCIIHNTQSALISQKQNEHNIYVIMKTMCPPGYHHNGFVASHALEQMIYDYTLLVPMNHRVLNKLSNEECRQTEMNKL